MSIEHPEKLLVEVAAALERLRIAYFVTGGFAVSVWGRPRATFDIDVVIQLMGRDLPHLAHALRSLSESGYLDEETAKRAAERGKGSFNFIHPESGIKIDFFVERNDAFASSQFKRRIAKVIDGQKIYFVSPEDLILAKLKWHQESGSSRQLEDIESVFKISGNRLDLAYVEKWAKELGGWDIIRRYVV